MDSHSEIATARANGVVTAFRPHFQLVKADADMLQKLWFSVVRPGLLAIKAKNPRLTRWEPEHVRAHLEAGLRGLMLCELHLIVRADKPTPVGFIVLKLYNDEFLQVPMALYTWITYSTDPAGTLPITEAVEKRARELGVRAVQGMTSRIGWARRLRKRGYRVVGYLIEKEF